MQKKRLVRLVPLWSKTGSLSILWLECSASYSLLHPPSKKDTFEITSLQCSLLIHCNLQERVQKIVAYTVELQDNDHLGTRGHSAY